MYHANVYCALCGVILLPGRRAEERTVPRRRRPWYAEARGIFMSNGKLDQIGLTGVGLLSVKNCLEAPLDSESSYLDSEELVELLLFQQRDSRWGFGFHDSCWSFLRARLAHVKDEVGILRSIFAQLYNTPCRNFSSLDFGHDYEGASGTHQIHGLPKPVDFQSPLYADPLCIPSFDSLEIIQPLEFEIGGLKTGEEYLNRSERRTCGVLGHIPLEVLYEIIEYLSYEQVAKLRLVCRPLSYIMRIDQLPRSYWKSRFLLGQELDFLFHDTSSHHRDWFRLFWDASAFLGCQSLPMVNRKRIRDLLEPIAVLVEFDTRLQGSPCGAIISLAEDSRNPQQPGLEDDSGELPEELRMSSSFSGQIISAGNADLLEDGCRILQYRGIPFPFQQLEDGCQVIISGLQLGARQLISGFTFISLRGRDQVTHQLGFCSAPTVGIIDIQPGSEIETLEVAFCSVGLVGVRFICKGNNPLGWVGRSQGTGIACGILSISDCPKGCHLITGLDTFKIVTLGLGTSVKSSACVAEPSSLWLPNYSVMSRLWTPNIPVYNGLIVSTLLPSSDVGIFDPLINIDFGGPGGSLLGLLSRIVMHVVSDSSPIIGMSFFYTDGTVKTFGRTDSTELSFCIDGPGGERITQLGIVDKRPECTFGGLQIETNTGRTASFATLYRQAKGLDVIYLPSVQEGHVITGFVGSLKGTMGYFVRLGFHSQPHHQTSKALPSSQGYEPHSAPGECTEYNERFAIPVIGTKRVSNYQTYAPLRGVRRISASIGVSGRSRSPNRISGLKLEYHEQRDASIIGQWMEENDTFDLAPNECVSRLTVWITKQGMSGNYPGVRQGQVAAILIDTSHERSVTFCPPVAQYALHDCLLHQYQAGPSEEFMGISWVLNSYYDRVRGVMATDPNCKTSRLVPHLPPAFNQVQKVPFDVECGPYSSDKLERVVAHLRDQGLCGMKFVYESGKTISVGEPDSVEDSHIIEVPKSGQIVGLSSVVGDHTLKELKFSIEVYKSGRVIEMQHIRLPYDPSNRFESCSCYHRRDTWCRDRASASAVKPTRWTDGIHVPPDGTQLAGIYFSCQDFSQVGAIYDVVSDK